MFGILVEYNILQKYKLPSKTDQMSTLDIKRMIDVIDTIFYSVIHLKVE
ncbi:hypothetical protein Q361_10690 [Flavobacterium croceum DSM 17960]|uniref:Uncharacterized protein n=1 Tax=Flavobacterium croceum DSM 17960 TaxID=1121886 RepID=A0A2S4N8L6_9FLAO|nr:hypothetical protein Q361_10690 [Flavobacterium croceum DSM 17960]